MQVFKSPSSNNKYALIAEDGAVALGMAVGMLYNQVVLRFCVFSPGKPNMKHFNLRSQSGVYTEIETNKTRTGGQLDKITIQMKSETKGHVALSGLRDGEGERLIEWVKAQVEAEKMELVTSDAEFEKLFKINNDKNCVFVLPDGLKKEEPKYVEEDSVGEDEEFDDIEEDF